MPAAVAIDPEVAAALQANRPIVALESTLIAHGLPWPINLETALLAEEAVRGEGAVPATIAVLQGRPSVGITRDQLEQLAHGTEIMKASRRDLATAIEQSSPPVSVVVLTYNNWEFTEACLHSLLEQLAFLVWGWTARSQLAMPAPRKKDLH